MEWRHHRIWILALIIISGIVLAWFMFKEQAAAPAPVTDVATTTSSNDLSGRSIYTNGEYGFAVQYPGTARLEETFSPQYHLPATWRANALPDSEGTPIAAIIAYTTESDHSYPRYYVAQVRIGASTDASEVRGCLNATPNQGETELSDVEINGTTWKAFEFQNAGMQQYVKGVSYRTIHEGACIALEKIATGSSYRDDPDSPDDVADDVLEARYQSLDAIVESFIFARP